VAWDSSAVGDLVEGFVAAIANVHVLSKHAVSVLLAFLEACLTRCIDFSRSGTSQKLLYLSC
jgi:hypothetical protein